MRAASSRAEMVRGAAERQRQCETAARARQQHVEQTGVFGGEHGAASQLSAVLSMVSRACTQASCSPSAKAASARRTDRLRADPRRHSHGDERPRTRGGAALSAFGLVRGPAMARSRLRTAPSVEPRERLARGDHRARERARSAVSRAGTRSSSATPPDSRRRPPRCRAR